MRARDLLRRFAGALLLVGSLTWPGIGSGAAEEEDEIVVERTVRLTAELIDVQRVPTLDTRAIARFRVTSGGYRGATLSLAYDFAYPVRLRSWDVHDQSGRRRIGGARVSEPAQGQWDLLSRDGGPEPAGAIELTLVQHDLNADEKQRRWHFKRIEAMSRLDGPQ